MAAKVRKLEDLARLAGTSIATVSRALRNDPAVKAETRERIVQLAVANEFPFQRYVPLEPGGGGPAIAVVVPPPLPRQPRLSDPFLMELLAAIAEAGRERGCDILISHSTPTGQTEFGELLKRPGIDGTILLGQSSLHGAYNALADAGHRFAVWGAMLPGQRYCSIGSDNFDGGARAARHLLRLGRRRIAFLGSALNPEIAQRHQGYAQALEECGLSPDPALQVESHFDLESAESAVEALAASSVKFDAIVAASDVLALGAIRRLSSKGVAVPDDVAVIGYDNVAFGAYLRPALSTVAQDVGKAGRTFVSKLLGSSPGALVQSERLQTELIVRESCGG
jgi:DNA-binding LacI/PurR family transcriptional regulator